MTQIDNTPATVYTTTYTRMDYTDPTIPDLDFQVVVCRTLDEAKRRLIVAAQDDLDAEGLDYGWLDSNKIQGWPNNNKIHYLRDNTEVAPEHATTTLEVAANWYSRTSASSQTTILIEMQEVR